MASKIEDYAMIGDCETAALVARNGSIDWLCWPRFDSDACLASLLGTEENGRWRIAPKDQNARITRRYREATLILETDFETDEGAVRLIDFMPVRDGSSSLLRIVTGLRGSVSMRHDLNLRFDYGNIAPRQQPHARGLVAVVGPDLVVLHAPVDIIAEDRASRAEFTVSEGQRLAFELAYGASQQTPPPALDAQATLGKTEAFWRDWAAQFKTKTPWREPVLRSLITLKALIHRPTGGLVAAATTSLPERPHGKMNWDYRYCWIRDATFTLGALLNAGYHSEAIAWRDWLLRAVGGSVDKMQIMYRVDGARHLNEWEALWLAGYEGAKPVRIGNAASEQLQLDVYGELIDSMHLASRAGLGRSPAGVGVESDLVEHVERIWRDRDQGIWELRGPAQDYTYSKVMAWVAVDRFLRGDVTRHDASVGMLNRLQALRKTIHDEVCEHGYNARLGHFVEHYGSDCLDAALLLLPIVRFLPATDERMQRTIAAIQRSLQHGALVLRREQPGTGAEEGAFIPCSYWLADCLSMQGQQDKATELFEQLLDIRNDVGLLSEEYNIRKKQQAGNVPQALSHLGLVNTALGLSGPTLQRGA